MKRKLPALLAVIALYEIYFGGRSLWNGLYHYGDPHLNGITVLGHSVEGDWEMGILLSLHMPGILLGAGIFMLFAWAYIGVMIKYLLLIALNISNMLTLEAQHLSCGQLSSDQCLFVYRLDAGRRAAISLAMLVCLYLYRKRFSPDGRLDKDYLKAKNTAKR